MSNIHPLASDIHLKIPAWVREYLAQQPTTFPTASSRMDFVTSLAGLNIQHGTGGPFGAAVFCNDTNTVLAPGINLVVATQCSIAHAEVVALMLAQRTIGSYDLSEAKTSSRELVTSCEPCAMCLGAICWSGIRSLVCGATGSDAEAVGFDEGPKPTDWISSLKQRGITVTIHIDREKAAQVLRDYVQNGGQIYNGNQGPISHAL